jgi:hypothetical protein
MKPNNNENTPSSGGSFNLLGVALIATGLYLLYKWSKSAPEHEPEPEPEPTLAEQLAKIDDFRARVELAAKYHKVNLGRPQDYQMPSHSAFHGPHTVDGYFSAVYGAAIAHNRDRQLGWNFTEKDYFEVENKLLLDPKILADIAGHRGAPALDIRKKVQEEKPKSTPPAEPTPLDLLKQELATTPEFEKRIALAAKHFGVDLGRQYPAYGGGITGYTVDGFLSTVSNSVSSYNGSHKLNWDFKPADILAVENNLLLNIRIVATSAGPSLPSYVQETIYKGKSGKL